MVEKSELKMEQVGEKDAGGLRIEHREGEIEPPVLLEEAAVEELEPTPRAELPKGPVPLKPAVIRSTFRIPFELAAEATGWQGWKLSEELLADLVEVYTELGIKLDPRIQALILPIGITAEKFAGYQMWRRSGKPGDTRAKDWTGSPKEDLARRDE